MEDPGSPVPVETLLAHRAWVRRVARLLVADENEADDLEQEAMGEALARPPAPGRSLRGWFATAIHHDLVDRRRAEAARRRREEARSRPEAVPSAADLVAEAEAHRRVVVALVDLAEPYRSTILFRFFEDLPPSAIAAREGIPLETVRTRLRRGLALLRGRLDAGSGGDRRAWMLPLLPGLRGREGAVASVATGGILMAAKGWAVGAAVVLAAGIGWTVVAERGPPKEVAAAPAPGHAPALAPGPAPAPALAPAPAPASSPPTRPEPAPAVPSKPLPAFPVPDTARDPFPPAIRGHVRFAEGEAPPDRVNPCVRCLALLPGAPAVAENLRGAGALTAPLQERFGRRFVFARLKPGRYALGLQRSQNGPVVGVREVEVGDGILDVDLEFPPLRRSDWVAARVLGPDGRPVKDVEFRIVYSLPNGTTGGWLRRDLLPGEGGAVRVLVDDLPAGNSGLVLEVESPTLGIVRAPVANGEAVARFAAPAVAALRFEGYEEGGPWDRNLWFQFLPEDRGALATVVRGLALGNPGQVPDEEGRMDVPLQPGRYVLDVERTWRWTERLHKTKPPARPKHTPMTQGGTVAKVVVDLVPGRNEIRVALPALHTVTFRGVEEILALRRVGDSTFDLRWDADPAGTQVVEGLPAGEWYAFTGIEGKKRQKVAVPSVTEVQF